MSGPFGIAHGEQIAVLDQNVAAVEAGEAVRRVVLPDPDGPITATISPRSTRGSTRGG
jgi:hypothetical protein